VSDRVFLDANILLAAAWRADSGLTTLRNVPDARLRAKAHFSRARRDASESERPHGGACESLTFTTIRVDRMAAIWHDYYAI